MKLVNYWWHSVKDLLEKQKSSIKFSVGMLMLFLLIQILTWKTSDWIVAPFVILSIIFFGIFLPIWKKIQSSKERGGK